MHQEDQGVREVQVGAEALEGLPWAWHWADLEDQVGEVVEQQHLVDRVVLEDQVGEEGL